MIENVLNSVNKEANLTSEFKKDCLNKLGDGSNLQHLTGRCLELINNDQAIKVNDSDFEAKITQNEQANNDLINLTNKINEQKGIIEKLNENIIGENIPNSLNNKINSLNNEINSLYNKN